MKSKIIALPYRIEAEGARRHTDPPVVVNDFRSLASAMVGVTEEGETFGMFHTARRYALTYKGKLLAHWTYQADGKPVFNWTAPNVRKLLADKAAA